MGVVFGRPPGQRIKPDGYAVLTLIEKGQLYREIGHWFGLSKIRVLDIVKGERAT